MEGNNNAPFCIGQKVVAKYTASNKLGQKISKGTEYTVLGLRYTNCCGWYVDVGLSSPTEFEGRKVVFACACEKTAAPGSGIAWAMAGMFAPIDKREHSISIDKEIWDSLPKQTEERSDVVVKPQEASVQNQLLDTLDEMIALLPKMPIEQQEAYAQKIDDMINRTCKLIRGEL